MTTAEKTADYNRADLVERSKSLQDEALNDKEGGVFIYHEIHLEFIEKLDFKTASDTWTDEEKEKMKKLVKPMQDRINEFILKELENGLKK